MKRNCSVCQKLLALDSMNFPRDKTKPQGFAYACKPCTNERKRGGRKDRWGNMSPEQKTLKYANQRRYYATDGGRAAILASTYRKIDKKKGFQCDVDTEFLIKHIIIKPCIYCGDTQEQIGCDRIDNSKGHTKNNVVPACKTCNVSRMDNFTHEEMLVLGKIIHQIKSNRPNLQEAA